MAVELSDLPSIARHVMDTYRELESRHVFAGLLNTVGVRDATNVTIGFNAGGVQCTVTAQLFGAVPQLTLGASGALATALSNFLKRAAIDIYGRQRVIAFVGNDEGPSHGVCILYPVED